MKSGENPTNNPRLAPSNIDSPRTYAITQPRAAQKIIKIGKISSRFMRHYIFTAPLCHAGLKQFCHIYP